MTQYQLILKNLTTGQNSQKSQKLIFTTLLASKSTQEKLSEWKKLLAKQRVCLEDPKVKEAAINLYLKMRRDEAERFNDRSTVEQWKTTVEQALSYVSRRVIKQMMPGAARVDRSLVGDIRKRINTRKKRALGPVDKDVALLKRHYNWLKQFEAELIEGGIPQWLQ